MKYALIDTFNNVVLSMHRIERCAEDAMQKHDRQVRIANGAGSYIPKQIILDADHRLRVGDDVTADQYLKDNADTAED